MHRLYARLNVSVNPTRKKGREFIAKCRPLHREVMHKTTSDGTMKWTSSIGACCGLKYSFQHSNDRIYRVGVQTEENPAVAPSSEKLSKLPKTQTRTHARTCTQNYYDSKIILRYRTRDGKNVFDSNKNKNKTFQKYTVAETQKTGQRRPRCWFPSAERHKDRQLTY